MIVQREEKKDNRGFSLVELIIVIAIMAILVAVLAPQFLKYVERSRNAADVDNAKEITNAISAWAADTVVSQHLVSKGDSPAYTIEVDGTNLAITENKDDGNDTISLALKEAGLIKATNTNQKYTEITCRSNTTWTKYKIEVTVKSDGTVFFDYYGYEPKDSTSSAYTNTGEFAKMFQGGKATTSTGT